MKKREHTKIYPTRKEAEELMTTKEKGKTLKYEGVRPKSKDRKRNFFLWKDLHPSSSCLLPSVT